MTDDDPHRRPRRANTVQDCANCGSPAELQFAGEYICPDCYADEPGVGADVESRRETAAESRERLQELQEGDQ
ncbi:hypothetical protein [Natrinema thermotolerans]